MVSNLEFVWDLGFLLNNPQSETRKVSDTLLRIRSINTQFPWESASSIRFSGAYGMRAEHGYGCGLRIGLRGWVERERFADVTWIGATGSQPGFTRPKG
jgi:hypothetical protein